MSYDKGYHPAFVWGRWIVLVSVILIFTVVMTGFIPQVLQPTIIILAIIAIVIGGSIGISGGFKSFDRDAYPALIAFLLIPVAVVIIWYFTK